MANHSNYVLEGTITAEQPLATCSKDLVDREGGKNKPIPVPHTQTAQGTRLMFPATGLRGTLRRRVRDVVRQKVIEATGNEKPFDLDTHYMLTLGGIKGSGEEDKTSVLRTQEVRDSNPLLNLFGAGDAGTVGFLAGRLSVGNAICQDAGEPVIFSGARADDLYRDRDQLAFMSDADLMNLADRSKGNRERSQLKARRSQLNRDYYVARSEQASNEQLDAIQAQIKEVDEQMGRVKEETGSDNSVGMPLAGWQAIPQGAVMDHRMILRRATQVDLGLLLAGISAFSLDPIVGAHFSQGCGLISAQWEVFEVTPTGKETLGHIVCQPFEPASFPKSGPIPEALAEFDRFMSSSDWDFSVPTKG